MIMKTAVLLCIVAVAFAQQRPMRPPLNPDDNDRSRCGSDDMMCSNDDICIETRMDMDSALRDCLQRSGESGSCMPTMNFERNTDRDREDKFRDDSGMRDDFQRIAQDKGEGARDRDTARTVNGALGRTPCAQNLRCQDNMCMMPQTPSACDMRRETDNQTRCDPSTGMFNPTQCRRMPGERAPSCQCVNVMTGAMIPNTLRNNVTRRDDIPDCERHSFEGCNVMRDGPEGRMIRVRHDESVPMREGGMCRACRCNNGRFECSAPEDSQAMCTRSDPQDDQPPRNCMMEGGEMVMHNQQREDGKCNRCGCRNGNLQCTELPECRHENDNADGAGDSDRDMRDRMCEECMDMPHGPVCAVRDGRTFPTRCHAMRCQGFEADDLEEGACADRDACSEDEMCGENFHCMRRGGETRMSRETDMPDNRRMCVNRMGIRCLPTVTLPNGERRIRDINPTDAFPRPDERPTRDSPTRPTGDGDRMRPDTDDRDRDDNDRTVCASDGNTYPSTCHMIAESPGDMLPRAMHTGPCRDTDDTNNEDERVCGSDGMTYQDEGTMRTTGGNIHMDYRGRCAMPEGGDDTPRRRCEMVRENRRCPNMTMCGRMFMPADGCCPMCGSAVIMAIDQEALDEHIRVTGEDDNVDEFNGRMFRGTGDREPIIPEETLMRCNMTMTRPVTMPGNVTELMFLARNMSMDAMYCHQQAMRVMMRFNDMDSTATTVPLEESLVAAAVASPEAEVPDGSGAPALTASCLMLICGFLMAAIF